MKMKPSSALARFLDPNKTKIVDTVYGLPVEMCGQVTLVVSFTDATGVELCGSRKEHLEFFLYFGTRGTTRTSGKSSGCHTLEEVIKFLQKPVEPHHDDLDTTEYGRDLLWG
jgi:hypothetical protein